MSPAAAAAVVMSLWAAQPSEPGPAIPEPFVTAGHRVHVYASEDLNADSLRGLARPGVVLWLSTRSNMLRAPTLEALRRFGEAWVELRPPILSAHVLALQRAPTTGLWLRAAGDPNLVKVLGVRRLAQDVSGPLDEAQFGRAAAAHRVNWAPAALDLEGYSKLVQLSGVPTVFVPAEAAPPTCAPGLHRGARRAIFRVTHVAQALALTRCGAKVRLSVPPEVTTETLRSLFQLAPDAELEVQVGTDERKAMRTRQLLERLEAASGVAAPRR